MRLPLLLLLLCSCGSSTSDRSESYSGHMGPLPRSWYCVSFDGPEARPGHFHPCFPDNARCLKNRDIALKNGYINMSECEPEPVAFCYLSDETTPPTRPCHYTLKTCDESREYQRSLGLTVTECTRLPP